MNRIAYLQGYMEKQAAKPGIIDLFLSKKLYKNPRIDAAMAEVLKKFKGIKNEAPTGLSRIDQSMVDAQSAFSRAAGKTN